MNGSPIFVVQSWHRLRVAKGSLLSGLQPKDCSLAAVGLQHHQLEPLLADLRLLGKLLHLLRNAQPEL